MTSPDNDDKMTNSNIETNDQESSNDREGNSASGSESCTRQESHSTDDEVKNIKDGLTRDETILVHRLRSIVILIMTAIGIAVSYFLYRLLHDAEVNDFELEFEGVAEMVIDALKGTSSNMRQCLLQHRILTRRDSTILSNSNKHK